MSEKWVGVAEASEVLGVHPRTLRRAIDRGEFPGVKIGRRYRVPPSALAGEHLTEEASSDNVVAVTFGGKARAS